MSLLYISFIIVVLVTRRLKSVKYMKPVSAFEIVLIKCVSSFISCFLLYYSKDLTYFRITQYYYSSFSNYE